MKNLGTHDLRDSWLVFCAESVVGYSSSYAIELAVFILSYILDNTVLLELISVKPVNLHNSVFAGEKFETYLYFAVVSASNARQPGLPRDLV